MKTIKTFLLFILFANLLIVGCEKNETPIEEEFIAEEQEVEEVEMEEETPVNPDLDLLGGQGAFTITPGGGIISGETSVNFKIIFDNTQIQIPNDSLEYKIDWKTNGIYGSLTDELKEISISDFNGMTYTSTDIETTEGEEKFVATLYSRPKESNEEFTLNGSALAALSITNEPKKKYFALGATYWLRDSFAEGNGTRNIFVMGYLIPENINAVSYQLNVNEIIYDSFPFEQNRTFNWSNDFERTSYINFVEDVYRVGLLSNSTNTSHQPNYDINYNNTVNVSGSAQLIITFEE